MAVMSPRLRKFALTLHVTTSVGWLGSVAAFLALAVAGLTAQDATTIGGAQVAMQVTGWYAIVPLSLAALATGLIQSLGTVWGLFRHYWVLVKLVITVLATAVLLIHMQVVDRVAMAPATAGGDFARMRAQLVVDAGAALLVLIVAVVFSVYKPKGLTRYGRGAVRPGGSARSASAAAAG
ncbi:hypothetical protein [Rhizohabitans arisaemae]|uniref:hypothetical protein n=1 Tax=Rhizohabitans arisaemae TaxID=2720610 RepID=UPI0024B15D49|nr:hypothetical protein [Rhizohabitans arisaemae]